MGLCGGDPPQPDYVGAANASGQQAIDLARLQGRMSNPNVISPTGTTTVTMAGDQPTITQTLSPQQQQIYDLQQSNQAANQYALQQIGIPQMIQSMYQPYGITDYNAAYKPTQGFQYGISSQGTPGLIGSLDFSKLSAMPQASEAARQQVIDSMFGQGRRLLDPVFGQRQSSLDTALSNQGIFRGSEAFGAAQGDLDRARMQAYGDLADRAIQAGGAEQSRLFGLGMAARQQGAQEAQTLGQFQNQARNQFIGELLQQMGATNQAVGNAYNVAGQQAALQNAGLAQIHQLPTNIMNAIMSGSQAAPMPGAQFNPSQIQQTANPFQVAQAQYQSALGAQNARNAQFGQAANAATSLGSAYLMANALAPTAAATGAAAAGAGAAGTGAAMSDVAPWLIGLMMA